MSAGVATSSWRDCKEYPSPPSPCRRILEEMGVIKELVEADEIKFADNGGFISPSGLAFIGGPFCWITCMGLLCMLCALPAVCAGAPVPWGVPAYGCTSY